MTPEEGLVELSQTDRETHMHVIGSSGSGKSKFLEQMMRGDLDNRQGFCLMIAWKPVPGRTQLLFAQGS